ncbi:MAG: hypothetical protein IK093_18390 [Ruminiclostridium sp.]|nr:hypothetical protein [Ruminiclostridium sp.]
MERSAIETTSTATTTVTEVSADSVSEQALPEISFLSNGFPTLLAGISKIDDSEHVKYITLETFDKEEADAFIADITEWLGDNVKITDLTPQTGRSVQWGCDDSDKYLGIITLPWVDTEKFSNYPQMKLLFANYEKTFEESPR